MSTAHLVLEFRDDKGAVVTPSAARLIDDQGNAVVAFADDPPRGFAAEISSLDVGDYELSVELPKFPILPFRVKLADKSGKRVFGFRGTTPKCCTVARKQATEGEASSPLLYTASFTIGATYEELVFAAGWDYSGGSDNTKWCTTWRDDLYDGHTWLTNKKTTITKIVHDHTVVSMFDFKSGNRIRWIKGQKGWHVMDSVLQGTVKTHTGSYKKEANKKKRHDDDSISILHVYDHIATLGSKAPGSVIGFHVFSHAWAGGPILVNTDQDAEFDDGARSDERDPGDKDGRTKDFTAKNMAKRADFKAAFKAGAVLKIWGCFATTDYRRLVRAAHAAGKDKDKKIEVMYGGEMRETTAQVIEDAFRNQVFPNSYMAKMAKAVGTTVIGAPPGMGANLRSKGGGYYMFVDQRTYKKEYAWYKSALGLVPDDSGHLPYK